MSACFAMHMKECNTCQGKVLYSLQSHCSCTLASWCSPNFCRYYGAFKADLLQQFVADELLQLPVIQTVSPHTLNRFLDKIPQHKVAVLAFSTSAKASIPLRHAVQQHSHLVTAGRIQWSNEVTHK